MAQTPVTLRPMRKSLPRFCTVLLATIGFSSLFAQPIPTNALSFDGTDDYVLTTAQGASGNSARTVEAWVKTTANCVPGAGGGVQQTIVDWGVFATGSRFTFNLLWANAPRLEVGGTFGQLLFDVSISAVSRLGSTVIPTSSLSEENTRFTEASFLRQISTG